MRFLRSIVPVLFMFIVGFARAGGPVNWRFQARETATGQTVVTLRAVCDEGWHLYALSLPREDGPLPTVITVTPSTDFKAGKVIEPVPTEVQDPNFQMLVRYHGGEPEFIVPIERLSRDAFIVEGSVEFMCCNDQLCLPPVTVKFSVSIPSSK